MFLIGVTRCRYIMNFWLVARRKKSLATVAKGAIIFLGATYLFDQHYKIYLCTKAVAFMKPILILARKTQTMCVQTSFLIIAKLQT